MTRGYIQIPLPTRLLGKVEQDKKITSKASEWPKIMYEVRSLFSQVHIGITRSSKVKLSKIMPILLEIVHYLKNNPSNRQ